MICLYAAEEEIEWVKEVMTGVLQARGALEAAKRPLGTRSNPALSCRDLKATHVNISDGKNIYLHYKCEVILFVAVCRLRLHD